MKAAAARGWRGPLSCWALTALMLGHTVALAGGASEPAAAVATIEPVLASLDAARADHLLRFLGYVVFPGTTLPPPGQPLVVAVAGADEVYQALGPLVAQRVSHQRPVVRRQINEGDPLLGVHLLYIGRRVDLQQSPLMRAARAAPLLLVTEHPDGLAAGALFNFITVQEQLRFEASLIAADRAGVTVSSRLLALADRVLGGR